MNASEVIQVKGYGYIVPSQSSPGAWRLVQGDHCSCPAEGMCRHRQAVAAFCREQDALHRRPSAPAHISALVD